MHCSISWIRTHWLSNCILFHTVLQKTILTWTASIQKRLKSVEKWNMPYLDMRKHSQIAMTAKNKSAYTKNANSGVGDGVHPVESWYRTFYSPVIDQKLRNLGIGYTTASVAPTVIAVTSVSLGKNTLSIKKEKCNTDSNSKAIKCNESIG